VIATAPSPSSSVVRKKPPHSATTTFSYAGTSYANPHAPTSIGATTYSYDNNGNLTTARQWTYAWDYRNRLTSAGNGLATTTFSGSALSIPMNTVTKSQSRMSGSNSWSSAILIAATISCARPFHSSVGTHR
jgi:hypothetical protein